MKSINSIDIFGVQIPIKDNYCSLNGCKPLTIKTPYINMYVKVTNHCNANCKFCTFSNNKCTRVFEPYKMYFVLNEVIDKIKINKISFTGGETTLDFEKLSLAIRLVKRLNKNIFTVVHTNGTYLHSLDALADEGLIDSISLSRHHYNQFKNEELFRCAAVQTITSITNFRNKKKIHFSCNLIKGYIDSNIEVIKYLEHAAELGINDVGFVSLMKVNSYSKENHVDFENILIDNKLWDDKEPIEKIREWSMSECCKCANFLYLAKNNELVKFYARYYMEPDNKIGNLVYDIDCLKNGFNGETLFSTL